MTDYRIRVSRHIIGHLEGSSAWQEPNAKLADGRPYCCPEEIRLVDKIKAASTREDGSVIVTLDDDERAVLDEHVEVQAIGASDNAKDYRPGEPGGAEYVAELNACRALRRKLAKIAATEAKIERLCR